MEPEFVSISIPYVFSRFSPVFLRSLALIVLLLSFKSARAGQVEVISRTSLPRELLKSSVLDQKPATWRYWLHLPTDYEGSTKDWPVIVYLHGRSCRGNDLQKVKRYGLPAILDRQPKFPFIVVSPQLPDLTWPAQGVLKWLDEIEATYRVDSTRVYLTGVSMGGGGAWNVAAADPRRFAAIAPVCGYGHSSMAKKLSNLPIWAFHGDADKITPIDPHRQLVQAVNVYGGNARLTEIPGGTHGDIIFPTYKRADLYEWFLAHRRSEQQKTRVWRAKPIAAVQVQSQPEVSQLPAVTPEISQMPAGDAKAKPALAHPSDVGLVEYEVQKGDSLWRIGKNHGVSVASIKSANRLVSDRIYVGQKLKVPVPN